jgi:hypothetical protein
LVFLPRKKTKCAKGGLGSGCSFTILLLGACNGDPGPVFEIGVGWEDDLLTGFKAIENATVILSAIVAEFELAEFRGAVW